MRTIVDLLQIALALTLPVLLVLAVAKRRRRDLERQDSETDHPSAGETTHESEASSSSRPGPRRTVRRPGEPRPQTINLGHDRELARNVIAALESQGVRVKLSERRNVGAESGMTFEIRYKPEDEAVVQKELLRAFDVDN